MLRLPVPALLREDVVSSYDALGEDLTAFFLGLPTEYERARLYRGDGAHTAMQRAVELDPGEVTARFNLGVVSVRMGRDQEAVDHYRQAIELNPDYTDAHFNLANGLRRLGRIEASIPHYRRVLTEDPANEMARLGEIYALVRLGRYAEARGRLEEGLQGIPLSRHLRNGLARVLAAAPDSGVRDGARRQVSMLGLPMMFGRLSFNVKHGLPLLISLLIGAFGVAAEPPQRGLSELAQADYSTRFAAALSLVNSPDPALDERLRGFLAEGGFRDAKEARATVEFILWKRSGGPLPPGPPSVPQGPNTILVSIDTLRADHLGCYGYDRETSPALDALARDGAVFLNAIAPAPWTLPTHMSLLTSLYPSFHKLEKGGAIGSVRLDESERTLAQELGQEVTTAAFVAHPFLDSSWGFDRGFDLYRRYDTRAGEQSERASMWLEWHAFHARRGLSSPGFLLFLHYIDPHEPYDPPAPHRERFVKGYKGSLRSKDNLASLFADREFESRAELDYVIGLYDGEIHYVDASLGKIFDTLRRLGWKDSTLVVVTADHGEEFKDHGSMGHKDTLYDEQLRVPLIVSYPQQIVAGQRISGQVSLVDVFPTVLELMGQAVPRKIQGASLTSHMKTRSVPEPSGRGMRPVFAELGPLGTPWERKIYRRAVRTNDFKLILNYLEDGTVTKELYRLDRDPGERKNVYAELADDERITRLLGTLERFIRQGAAYNAEFREKNSIEIDEELLKRLRSLGYVD